MLVDMSTFGAPCFLRYRWQRTDYDSYVKLTGADVFSGDYGFGGGPEGVYGVHFARLGGNPYITEIGNYWYVVWLETVDEDTTYTNYLLRTANIFGQDVQWETDWTQDPVTGSGGWLTSFTPTSNYYNVPLPLGTTKWQYMYFPCVCAAHMPFVDTDCDVTVTVTRGFPFANTQFVINGVTYSSGAVATVPAVDGITITFPAVDGYTKPADIVFDGVPSRHHVFSAAYTEPPPEPPESSSSSGESSSSEGGGSGYQVSNAGMAAVNGLYADNGTTHNGQPVYAFVNGDTTYYLYYQIDDDNAEAWVIDSAVGNSYDPMFTGFYHCATITGQWDNAASMSAGATPAPTVTAS